MVSLLIQKSRKKDLSLILSLCNKNKIKYQFVPQKKLDELCNINHQGIIAKIFPPGFLSPDQIWNRLKKAKFPLLLALDQVQDQGNIGVLARTLYCLDGAGLVITKHRSAFLGERAFKSSSGALNHLPVVQVTNMADFLKSCQEKGCLVYYAGIEDNCKNLYEIKVNFPAVLVLGNEEKGVRPKVKSVCDIGIKIPMINEFDSLNVAQAGAIIIGEFFRQKFSK